MPRDSDQHSDPAVAGVFLAAEAALIEARLRLLQEAIATVDARIRAISDALGRLHPADPASSGANSGND
ncbi:hypothetical protein [Streptomyces sp. T028]|uniref:hypothetical protein n=1 Tax=Streptomyces sp. T028 TaxID=3394379 RepID=UPI003A861EE4